jgi:hypothetical protein
LGSERASPQLVNELSGSWPILPPNEKNKAEARQDRDRLKAG